MKIFALTTLMINVCTLILCTTCISKTYHQANDTGMIMYKRTDGLKLKPKEQKRVLWDNGKLCYVAMGLPNGLIQWQLYARSIPEDSVLMITKNDHLHGIYSEHSKNKHIIGYFRNNQRDGIFLLKRNEKIVAYEFWEGGKLVKTFDATLLPEAAIPILTFYNKW